MAGQFTQLSPPMPAKPSMVLLNVYDLVGTNKTTEYLGLGVYHSGVEVHGVEYAFGGHDSAVTGVWSMTPKHVEGARFRESIELGYTIFSPDDVTRIVNNFAKEYRGNTYHLLKRNCNHFSSDLAKALCGEDIPSYINRLARAGKPLDYVKPLRKWFTFAPVNDPQPSAIPSGNTNSNGSSSSSSNISKSPEAKKEDHERKTSWWQEKLAQLQEKNRQFAEARQARREAAALAERKAARAAAAAAAPGGGGGGGGGGEEGVGVNDSTSGYGNGDRNGNDSNVDLDASYEMMSPAEEGVDADEQG